MTFRLDWRQLLSDRRHTLETSRPSAPNDSKSAETDPRTPFERDYDRIIFSAPFRRLARKTQVHPFAEMDHIHNRLTHTLEVASVGRSLGRAAGQFLSARGELPADRSAEDLTCIVQAACLAHDIGNPPFGHAGEFAIREWVRANAGKLFDAEERATGIARDWLSFEGNAQSFRMVARADNREQIYIRFTYASLGAMIKYPWDSDDPRAATTKKFNYFASEESIFRDVMMTLGLGKPDGEIVRHPLSFLTEAADDICYQIGDFEDAVQMRILPEKEVRAIFARIIGHSDDRPLPAMRAKAIGCLVRAASEAFEKGHEAMMTGARSPELALKHDFPAHMQQALRDIKELYPHIFGHRPKVAIELGAPSILGKILGVYTGVIRSLTDHRDYEELGFTQKRQMDLAWPERYARDNQSMSYEWWLGRVMDFVAGMTDNYATQVAREIGG